MASNRKSLNRWKQVSLECSEVMTTTTTRNGLSSIMSPNRLPYSIEKEDEKEHQQKAFTPRLLPPRSGLRWPSLASNEPRATKFSSRKPTGRRRGGSLACCPSSSLPLILNLLLLLPPILFASATLPPTTRQAVTTTSLPASAQSSPQQQQQTDVYPQSPEVASPLFSDQSKSPGISKRAVTNRQGPSAATIQEVTTNGANADELGGDLELVQALLVSVKGSIAFWRPPADHQAQDHGSMQQQQQQQQQKSRNVQATMATGSGGRPPATACGSLAFSGRPQGQGPSHTSSLSSVTTAPVSEIVAVEGTNIKLNLVILGHRRRKQPGQAAINRDSQQEQPGNLAQQQQQQQLDRLKLQWSRNGEPMAANVPGSRFLQQLISSDSTDTTPRQFLIQLPGTHTNHSTLNVVPQFGANIYLRSGQSLLPSQANEHFMLAPYVVASGEQPALFQHQQEQQSPDVAKRLLGLAARRPPGQLAATSQPPMIDDFMADGQSIEWGKLEAYLRYSAQQHLSQHLGPTECHPGGQQQVTLERLALIQIELNRLSSTDQGLYQLRVCPAPLAASNAGNGPPASQAPSDHLCQPQAVFNLQVVEDVPHLEGLKQDRRILLEPGERFSIKCEATGYTLPQITWFLNGQQLNEHNQQAQDHSIGQITGGFNGGATSGVNQLDQLISSTTTQGRLRIGDYVSQDNRVHSFVNSSQVQPTDGGFYKCQANNGLHSVELESRIDVRGPPVMARKLVNTSVLIGQSQLRLQCPYSGHPIGSVEWYFRPSTSTSAGQQHSWPSMHSMRSSFSASGSQDSDYPPQPMALVSSGGGGSSSLSPALRARRRSDAELVESMDSNGGFSDSDDSRSGSGSGSGRAAISGGSHLIDADQDGDPDHDEWLSQASAMTPSSPEDYPEPLPDYPAPGGLLPAQLGGGPDASSALGAIDYDDGLALAEFRSAAAAAAAAMPPDYSDIGMDLQQDGAGESARRRKRRDTATASADMGATEEPWIKFPQSRRHQVHLNGTLIIQDVSRTDQGFYKCRALASVTNGPHQQQQYHPNRHMMEPDGEGAGSSRVEEAHSNELYLTVLVPPVISPFASAETLREGMRNFLTCSVIEGDSPVRLGWLKDGQPIEEYMAQRALQDQAVQQQAANYQHQQQTSSSSSAIGIWGQNQSQTHQARIRVDTTNEYTSTLYFSHVDFKDNGNYTCMATNKAASVNYTARMLVNVPPKWVKAPKDIECVAGQNIVIDCQAQAHPSARVWWEIGVPSAATDPHAGGAGSSVNGGATKDGKIAASNKAESLMNGLLHNNHHHHNAAAVAAANQLLESQQPPNHYRTIISNSRIHILENASLVIRDVSKLDQGYYLCQAANNFGSLSSLIKLTVNVGASFSNKYLVKYVKMNDRIELDCDPIGQSPVDVTWYMRQQTSASSSNAPIVVRTNQLNHNNSTSSPANHLHHLQPNQSSSPPQSSLDASGGLNFRQQQQQQGQPLPQADSLGRRLFTGTIRTELQQNSGLIGGTMKALPAAAQAYLDHPQEQTTVTGDDGARPPRTRLPEALDTSGQFELASQVVELDSSMSFELVRRSGGQSELVRLIVKQARRGHSADFICQANNRYGSDEKLIKLLVQEAPDPVQEISATQVGSRSISLTWLPPFNGNSPITSYTVEWAQAHATTGAPNKWSHQVMQQPSFTIAPLEPMTSYEIRVRAHNQFGQSSTWTGNNPQQASQRDSLVVTTIEEAPNAPPHEIRAIPLSSSSIQLSWLPPPGAQQVQQHLDQTGGDSSGSDMSFNKHATKQQQLYPIKGYYLGYKMANLKNDSFIHKEVVVTHPAPQSAQAHPSSSPLFLDNNTNSSSGQHLQMDGWQNSNSSSATNEIISLHKQMQSPVGLPPSSSNQRLKVVIGDLRRNTKYVMIVQAFNSAGFGPQSDQIEASTLLNDPPPAPQLRVGTVSYKSIELQWSFQLDSNQPLLDRSLSDTSSVVNDVSAHYHLQAAIKQEQKPASPAILLVDSSTSGSAAAAATSPVEATVDGYHLYYRSSGSQWLEKKLRPETHQLQPISPLQRNEIVIVERAAAEPTRSTSPAAASGSQLPLAATSSGLPSALTPWHRDSSLVALAQKSFSYKLDQLNCGNSYQIYLVAYNSIGSGSPSQIIRTKTRGSAPIAPRRQDFLTINSTYVQLNLDAWMDGGCSISNFEVRYKQLGASLRNAQTEVAGSGASGSQRQWLLLSNNISPEQRTLELRDLVPETWYSIEAIAESVAGKAEQQYSFMTLDKFGQVPLEALESASSNGNSNHLPALFRSNGGSIRSILHNFSTNNGGLMAPMVLSACMFLILFASCSLFLIRRYNNIMKGDNASVDSQTTSAALSTSHYHHHHHTAPMSTDSMDCNSTLMAAQSKLQMLGPNHHHQPHYHHYSSSSGHEQYSLKSSPCKTTTSTTLVAGNGGGSSTNDGSSTSGGMMMMGGLNENPYLRNTADASQRRPQLGETEDRSPIDLSQLFMANNGGQCYHQQFHPHLSPCNGNGLQNQTTNEGGDDEFCHGMVDGCDPSQSSPVINSQQAKFATLTREGVLEMICEQQQQQSVSNRFKTMPHNHLRPVSTFIQPQLSHNNNNYQQTIACPAAPARYNIYNSEGQQQLHHDYNQQQIYSKLRLIHNSNSNYNLCPEVGNHQNKATAEMASGGCHQLNQDHQINQVLQHNGGGDTINLAVLAQQNSKLLSCTLKRNQPANPLSYPIPPDAVCQASDLPLGQDQLTSLLIGAGDEHQQRQVDNQNNGGYGTASYLSQQQQQQHQVAGNDVVMSATNGFHAYGAPPSITSGSSTNSTQPTTTSSSLSTGAHNSTDQLLNLGTTNHNNKCQMQDANPNQCQTGGAKKTGCKAANCSSGAQAQQQQNLTTTTCQAQQSNSTPTNGNEPSDYALPFPPKWV